MTNWTEGIDPVIGIGDIATHATAVAAHGVTQLDGVIERNAAIATHTADIDAHVVGATAGHLLVATGASAAVWKSTGAVLSAPDISGTVTAAQALTMPAFSYGGAVDANNYQTVNFKVGTAAIAATAANRGKMYVDEGTAGVADKMYCVMKGTADTYTAIQIAIG